MSSPVYLLSSLPTLDVNFGLDENDASRTLVPSVEDFLDLCDRNLDPSEAIKIRTAVQNPSESTLLIVKELMQYLGAVHDVSAQKRWAILSTKFANTDNEHSPWQGSYLQMFVNDSIPVSADAPHIVSTAGDQANPLEREKYIITSLWSYLDHCDSQYQVSIENLIIYAYKIKLYQRFVSFNYEKGDAKWNLLIAGLAQKAGFSPDSITGTKDNKMSGGIHE